jgi:flagellar motor switch protein FliG
LNKKDLSSLKKSAIILNILGEKSCQKIFSCLKDSEVRKIVKEMQKINKVSHKLAKDLLEDFYKVLSEEETLIFEGESFFFKGTKGEKERQELLKFLKKRPKVKATNN